MSKNIDKNNDIEMVFGDKVIIAGVDPNLNPSIRKDSVGRSKKETAITGSMGDVSMESADVTYQQCDNGSDRPTGMINLVGMNGVKIEAGAGGITMATAGCINLMPAGGLCNITATEGLSCISKNVNIASTGSTNIGGGSLSVESQTSSFANNVSMQGNTKMSGGCFINGEAFIPHMTTQKQENQTEDSGACSGFLNPCQTFILIPGDKSLVEASSGGDSILIKLEITEESLLKAMQQLLITPSQNLWKVPDPLGRIELKAKPILTHAISKGVLNQLNLVAPTLKSAILKEHKGLGGLFDLTDTESDFTVMGHRHKFYGPACSYCDSTSELYEAAKAVEGNEPVTHKPCEPNGSAEATKKMLEEDKEAAKKYMENMGKTFGKSVKKSLFGLFS